MAKQIRGSSLRERMGAEMHIEISQLVRYHLRTCAAPGCRRVCVAQRGFKDRTAGAVAHGGAGLQEQGQSLPEFLRIERLVEVVLSAETK